MAKEKKTEDKKPQKKATHNPKAGPRKMKSPNPPHPTTAVNRTRGRYAAKFGMKLRDISASFNEKLPQFSADRDIDAFASYLKMGKLLLKEQGKPFYHMADACAAMRQRYGY